MKAKAAIVWEQNTPWSVEAIELDEPQKHEVLVRMVASGLRLSDDHGVTGYRPVALPMIGGHEGAGVIEAIGPEVEDLEAGDHVVPSFIPACGKCRWCVNGHTTCVTTVHTSLLAADQEGPVPMHAGRVWNCSPFSERSPTTPWCRNRQWSRPTSGFHSRRHAYSAAA